MAAELSHMSPLQIKQHSKRSRFSATRSINYCYVPKNPDGDATPPQSVPARPRRPNTRDFESLVLTVYVAPFIRSLFPVGMMVAAIILLLNAIVLLSIPAPEIKGSLAGIPIQLVVITPLFYLLFGTITRLTLAANAKCDCRNQASVVLKVCPSTTAV